MTFYIIFLDECLAQLSSELFPPLARGNRYRDSHQENIQRVRDLGTLNTKWVVSNKTLPSGLRDPYRKKKGKRSLRARKTEDPKAKEPSKHTRANVYMNSRKMWKPAPTLQGSAPDGGPSMSTELDISSIPNSEVISS